METDDAFRVAISGNLLGNIGFDVDVFDPRRDRASQQHQSILFRLHPATPVFPPPRGHDHRARTTIEQSREADSSTDKVQPQFDELPPLVRRGIDVLQSSACGGRDRE